MAVGKLVSFRNASINKALRRKTILISHTHREAQLYLKNYFLWSPPFWYFLSSLDLILAALKDKVCSLHLNSAGIFELGVFLLLPPTGQNLGGISDSNHARPCRKFRGQQAGKEEGHGPSSQTWDGWIFQRQWKDFRLNCLLCPREFETCAFHFSDFSNKKPQKGCRPSNTSQWKDQVKIYQAKEKTWFSSLWLALNATATAL